LPAVSGARISVYQPPPGQISTTVSARLDPEEAQRLDRMAIFVARDIGRRARGRGDRVLDRAALGSRLARGGDAGNRDGGR
jgi:hypothetical protein